MDTKSYIYVLVFKDQKLLKIGRTNNLVKRLTSLS
ncbi:MAG: GIY-YIG nuclease family protein, partial [Clostridiales bacterium]|nr:GIY-YIG nuclease family protein [Clostridiales bacterium]